jgi:hypothetical protein
MRRHGLGFLLEQIKKVLVHGGIVGEFRMKR